MTGTAPPWTPPEREAAWEMRNALTALALRGAARDMAHLNDELARRNQELDAFAYVASHDLKAPLRGISQLVDWIEEDFADKIGDEGRVYLEKLRGRVGRMQGLINGVLDYARAGRTALKREKTDVGVLLAEIVDLLSPRPGIEVVIAPDLPTLTTERLPLQQVFQNLISNALKYNLSPQGHVWITWEMSDGVPQFAVTDDGPGIAPEYHQKIFGVFQTLQARDSVESTGIGLALVRKIVEGRGGKVSVESQAGDGATFRFTWPLGGSRS